MHNDTKQSVFILSALNTATVERQQPRPIQMNIQCHCPDEKLSETLDVVHLDTNQNL